MQLLAKHQLPPLSRGDTVFRVSIWGALLALLLFGAAWAGGIAFFVIGYRAGIVWVMIATALYTLLLTWVCQIVWLTIHAIRSPANWLLRLGSNGLLLKYRSYLHDDSPQQDPIALQLSWTEIAAAQLQSEIHSNYDRDGKSEVRRWFLVLRLDPRYIDLEPIKAALAFEAQRQPAHFRIDELRHQLFAARKSGAPEAEIKALKMEIAVEKKRHSGKESKLRFHDRPIVFVPPDSLKMEWTHITPGKKTLQQLLALHTSVSAGPEQHCDTTRTVAESEFQAQLDTLLGRDEKIEAIKLVRHHLGLGLAEAKDYVEKRQR